MIGNDYPLDCKWGNGVYLNSFLFLQYLEYYYGSYALKKEFIMLHSGIISPLGIILYDIHQ